MGLLFGGSVVTVLLVAQAAPAPLPTLTATSAAPVAPAPVAPVAPVAAYPVAPVAPVATYPAAPATVAPPPAVPAPVVNPEQPPDTQPVLRAAPGNWGMTFIFGGLAPLTLGGLGDRKIGDGLLFTEIGVRRVFKRVVIPFSIGAGISRAQPEGATAKTTTAGVSASVAVLKGFRVWRRIAPYWGAFFHTHYIHAGGSGNWLLNFSVGPILGIEYFLADRVSLYGQGVFGIGPDITRTTVSVSASSAIAAGGQLGLTFYF
jgi:hypothetical protein